MNKFDNSKITEDEKARYRISNLADRPNAFSSYRENKMSADDVKKAFDAQMEFLARKHNELNESAEELYETLRESVKAFGEFAFPVGSVYITFSDVSPSETLNGTWEELEEGRFLMSGAVSGNTGGAEKHSHDVSGWAWISGEGDGWGSGNLVWKERMFENGEMKLMDRVMGATLPGYVETATYYGTYVEGDTNNASSIPPYITVHMWRRIA